MISLPNGCKAGRLSVYPKNWQTNGASTKLPWYIHYRFYDPSNEKPMQVFVRGMNLYSLRSERQHATALLLKEETNMLLNQGYNPITKTFYVPAEGEIQPRTPFIKALWLAYEKIHGVKGTLIDIKCVITGSEKAARILGISSMPICDVSRKHIKLILEQCGKTNPRFSAHRYNKYRYYLIRLFKELIELEAATYNAPREISKQKITEKIRETLTEKQRQDVSDYLWKYNRPFWKFMQIFFHSGGRETELIQLQGRDVNLQTQKYKCLIKKGKHYREVYRTIKDIALPYWTEQMENCGENDYLFGRDLMPGPRAIRPDQIGRRWNHYVKKPLGITADFYSLKHLNTDETVDALGMVDAAVQNAHLGTTMVAKVYAINEKERQHMRLKQVNNKFA
jgi:integrase